MIFDGLTNTKAVESPEIALMRELYCSGVIDYPEDSDRLADLKVSELLEAVSYLGYAMVRNLNPENEKSYLRDFYLLQNALDQFEILSD